MSRTVFPLAPQLRELGPERQSLEEFLAKLPELWREGEVRPTHRKAPSSPRTWRTRKDPFEEVWPEILLRLQRDPDSTAKSLMERSLVHGIRDGSGGEQEPIVVGAS